MIKHAFAAIALVALAGMPVAQAQDGKAKGAAKGAAPAAAPAAGTSGKELYPKSYFDFLLKERVTAGQPD